jgi:hypothetical protein
MVTVLDASGRMRNHWWWRPGWRVGRRMCTWHATFEGHPALHGLAERYQAAPLLGTDDDHLDFRASVLVEAETVTLTTIVRIHNRRGRLYMALVWPMHPLVVKSMLYRALRRLAEGSSGGRRSSARGFGAG